MNLIKSFLLTRSYASYFSTNNATFPAQSRLEEAGGGFYHLLVTVGAFGTALVLILVFVTLMVGDSRKKSEGKGKLLVTVALAIALFSLSGVIAFVFRFGRDFQF